MRTLALDILKFVFQNNLSEIYPNVVTACTVFLTATVKSGVIKRIVKIKN